MPPTDPPRRGLSGWRLIACGLLALATSAPAAPDQAGLWSLAPLAAPAVPATAAHPVDAIVRARLAEKGLRPAPAADRRTLLRRLSYNLTGLPPDADEAAAFLTDPDPQAWEKLVDRLLASPRYGEHWARHWLDVANYADTHGNDHDYVRPNAWHYRDYVIRAFNDDKPYSRFVQEQVAGDALFPDNPQATVALGFIAAGPWDDTLMVTVRADTEDHRSAQNLDRDSMVSTVFGTFQSLTIHCARCHDHKFDPVSQREYYTLQAVFSGVDRADRPFDADPDTHARRRELLKRKNEIAARSPALLATLETPEVVQKVAASRETVAQREIAWMPFEVLSVVSTGAATLTKQSDGSWFASGTRPVRDNYIVTASWKPGTMRAMRLEALPDDRLPHRGPGRYDNGHFHLTEFRAFAAPPGSSESAQPVVFARATADVNEGPAMSAAQAIDGKDDTHWGIHPHYGERHEAVFELKEAADVAEGAVFTILLEHQGAAPGHGLGRFRLSASGEANTTALALPPAEFAALLKVSDAAMTGAQRQELALAVLAEENERALATLPPPQMVYAVTNDFPADGPNFTPSPQPRPIHVLARGELGRPGELVGPGTLACVPGMSAELTIADAGVESRRRAALALWLTDPRNVLTWRSIVNRVWAWHFGRGLCDTPNDFGKMGGAPSHPELLDWLAVWFRDEAKGSLKALHRLLLTSAVWQQKVVNNPDAAAHDPDNRLLWRMNRRRLTGEEVRDTALQLSGKLDLTMGGPPAVQFISRGDATFKPGGNPPFLDYANFDPDAPESRRLAVYRFLFRTVPDPFMDALDCPDGSSATPVRNVSTTAVQAFAMLNDAFLIRQCEHMAARLSTTAATPESQVDAAFQLLLHRAAGEQEKVKFAAYIRQHGLANACQLLLNSNEFLYLD
jgi:hypothetical protein